MEGGNEVEEWNQEHLKPFSFGETLTAKIANYYANEIYGRGVKGEYRDETTSVGLFPANDFGLCDMHGNAYEWCEDDWPGDYQNVPTDGSAWLNQDDDDAFKVLRGGAWLDLPGNCRSAFRDGVTRGGRSSRFGFRVACSLLGIP